jgi:hypothetical protein
MQQLESGETVFGDSDENSSQDPGLSDQSALKSFAAVLTSSPSSQIA